jgi:hypothetical protein
MENLDKQSGMISPFKKDLLSGQLTILVNAGKKLALVFGRQVLPADSLKELFISFIKTRFYLICFHTIEIFYILYN